MEESSRSRNRSLMREGGGGCGGTEVGQWWDGGTGRGQNQLLIATFRRELTNRSLRREGGGGCGGDGGGTVEGRWDR